MRTTSTGVVRVAFNVATKGMSSHGYTNGAPPDSPELDENSPPLPMPHFGAGPMPPVSSTLGAGVGGNTQSSAFPQTSISRRPTSFSSNSATGASVGLSSSGALNASAFPPSSSAMSGTTAQQLQTQPSADASATTGPPATSSGAAAALNASGVVGVGERRKGGSRRSSREASKERSGVKESLVPPSIHPVDDIISEGKN